MDGRDLIYLVLGCAIGVGALTLYQSHRAPTNFEECFLAETKGRHERTYGIVARLCRHQFPASSGP